MKTYVLVTSMAMIIVLGYTCSLLRARFEELDADDFGNSLRPVEKCMCGSGINKGSMDSVTVGGGTAIILRVHELLLLNVTMLLMLLDIDWSVPAV